MYFSPFLNTGATFACFKSVGVMPVSRDFVKSSVRIGAVCSRSSFKTLLCMLSGPQALWGFRFDSKFKIPGLCMDICGISGCGLGPLSGIFVFRSLVNTVWNWLLSMFALSCVSVTSMPSLLRGATPEFSVPMLLM